MKEIDWKDSQYATRHGSVSGLQLFTISWKSTREDPNWVMSCSLPGLEGERWRDDHETVLIAKAREVLADWLRRVFGILPADSEDAAFRAWYGRTDIGPDLDWCAVEGFEAGWQARAGETQ